MYQKHKAKQAGTIILLFFIFHCNTLAHSLVDKNNTFYPEGCKNRNLYERECCNVDLSPERDATSFSLGFI